jgi:hypothetical protein
LSASVKAQIEKAGGKADLIPAKKKGKPAKKK